MLSRTIRACGLGVVFQQPASDWRLAFWKKNPLQALFLQGAATRLRMTKRAATNLYSTQPVAGAHLAQHPVYVILHRLL